jgi:trans-aconitate methyltransferase
MTTDTQPTIDWRPWLERWDRQQTAYLPDREQRFTAMLDVLEALLPPEFVAVDLACGPGSIADRLLQRFPAARCVGVELDPVTLAMGRATLGDAGGRMRWLEADLMGDWAEQLGEEQVDAVLSTTALHWLPAEHLVRLYRDLGRLIRPGGVFLNGDNMAAGPELPSFNTVAQWRRDRLWTPEALAARQQESWAEWWAALGQEPTAAPLIAERTRRFGWMEDKSWKAPIYDVHVAALRDAGFREVSSIWQTLGNHVLMAVR